MSIVIIPEISLGNLERVLKHLPEPSYLEVALYGSFDYREISKQTEEEVPGLTIADKGGMIFIANNPSKQLIFLIYRSSIDAKKCQESTHYRTPSRRVDFHKAEWRLEGRAQIEVDPWNVNVQYSTHGAEPPCISDMRKELQGTDVNLTIKISSS